MEKHSTAFVNSKRSKLLRNTGMFNEIGAASRMKGSKWRQDFSKGDTRCGNGL